MIYLGRVCPRRRSRSCQTDDDMLAGSICSILTITYCLTYAALILSPPVRAVVSPMASRMTFCRRRWRRLSWPGAARCRSLLPARIPRPPPRSPPWLPSWRRALSGRPHALLAAGAHRDGAGDRHHRLLLPASASCAPAAPSASYPFR